MGSGSSRNIPSLTDCSLAHGVAVFSLALTAWVRAAWLVHFHPYPLDLVDAEGYHLLAVNLLAGRGFAIGWGPPFCPTAVRSPLYPLSLAGIYAALGEAPRYVAVLQILLEVLTTALTVVLAREVASHARAKVGIPGRVSLWVGPLAGLIYALNGTTQRFTGYLLAEALLLPLLTLALWTTLRLLRDPDPWRGWGVGVVWGLVLLTKPNPLYLAVGILLVAGGNLVHRCGGAAWRPLGAMFAGLTLCLAPWVMRNRLVFGRWLLSTAFEENLARVSAVAVLARVRGVEAEPWTDTWEYLYDQVVGVSRHVRERADVDCRTRLLWAARATSTARRILRRHGCAFVTTHLAGVAESLIDPGHRLWYRALTGRGWETTGTVPLIGERMAWSLGRGAVGDAWWALWQERVRHIPRNAGVIWWTLALGRLGLWMVALRGAWRLRGCITALGILLLTIVYHLMLPGPIAHDRLYMPAIPATVVLVALGLGLGWRMPTGGRRGGSYRRFSRSRFGGGP